MPQFLKLPSGTLVNLALVRRIVPDGNSGVSISFGQDDVVTLDAQDADFISKRLGNYTPLPAAARVTIFWIVIAIAIILVYLATRTARG